MKTYLIAGGAGFIGSHLCEKLVKNGEKVICVDNLITGDEKNISGLFKNKNFVFVNQDIINGLLHISEKLDGIFHLASPASPNANSPRSYMAYPLETLMVNSLGTKHMLELALSAKCPLVYASTSEVYGDPKVSPQTEDYFGNVNPNGVRSVYDEGKRFGEAICMSYFREFGVDTRIVRIFNTYGDRMQKDDGRVVSNFINQALENRDITIYGDGSQTRSFCYVDDLVDGLFAAMQKKEASGMVMNLGNPEEYTILQLAEKIREMVDSSSKIIHEDLPEDDPHKRKPDITRAKNILSFNPTIALDEGLSKTIEYFRRIG